MKNNVCPTATVIRWPNFSVNRICPKILRMVGSVDWTHDMIIVKRQLFNFSESRICPNIYRMLRSVDWTHDMIIVKWHLILIWHERILCALTNAPPVQSTQTGQWLSTLFHARRSGLCLVPSVIHLRSKFQATIIFAGITIHKKDILKNFLCIWWWQMLWWKHVNQKIIKNSNLIQAMKKNVCPKATVIRRTNFSENRIWSDVKCLKIYRMFRSVDWTHDMIIVKWHLFIWQERKFCALTNAPPVQSTQTGQWLSTLFHANCSAAQVYVLYPRQFIFALSCRRPSFWQVLPCTER